MRRSRRSEATSGPRQGAPGPRAARSGRAGVTNGVPGLCTGVAEGLSTVVGRRWGQGRQGPGHGRWRALGAGGAEGRARWLPGAVVPRAERGVTGRWGQGCRAGGAGLRGPRSRWGSGSPRAAGGCGNPPTPSRSFGYPPDRGSRHRWGCQWRGLGWQHPGSAAPPGRQHPPGRQRPEVGSAPGSQRSVCQRRSLGGSLALSKSHGPGQGLGQGQRRGRPSPVRTWIRRTRPGPHSALRRSRSLPWR
jgi:hypothetical protein